MVRCVSMALVMGLWEISQVEYAQEFARLEVGQAAAHATRGLIHESDLLSPTSPEDRRQREQPLRVPHPEHEQKPVIDQALTAPVTNIPTSTSVTGWGLSAGAGNWGTYIPPDKNGFTHSR